MASIEKGEYQNFCMDLYSKAKTIAGNKRLEAGHLLRALQDLRPDLKSPPTKQLRRIAKIFKLASEQQSSDNAAQLAEFGNVLSEMPEIQALSTTTRATIKIAAKRFSSLAPSTPAVKEDTILDQIDIWLSEFAETFRMWSNDFPLGVRKQITNLLNDVETLREKDSTKVKEALQGILAWFDESKPLSEPLQNLRQKTFNLLEDIQARQETPSPPVATSINDEAIPIPQEVMKRVDEMWALKSLVTEERLKFYSIPVDQIRFAKLTVEDLLFLLAFPPHGDPTYRSKIDTICQTLQTALESLSRETKEQAHEMLKTLLSIKEAGGGTANQPFCTCLKKYFPFLNQSETH